MNRGSAAAESAPRIVVAVCTHERNAELARLIEALLVNDRSLGGRATVGLSLADDNVDGRAREVFDRFSAQFSGESVYAHTGSGNISIARNAALGGGLEIGDWVAMTDDDCVPVEGWLTAYLDIQESTAADAVTGPCELDPPPGAPGWLVDQPFLESARIRLADGAESAIAATNNSFLRAEFFRDHHDVRFDPALGVLGGEDMVFFRTAHRAGLKIRFSTGAVVRGQESADRRTFRYQLWWHRWLGNTEFVTHDYFGDVNRLRWAARGVKLAGYGVVRPVARLARRETPQWRYSLALMAQGLGRILGAAGVRLRHH